MLGSIVLALLVSHVSLVPQAGTIRQPIPPAPAQPEQAWPPPGVYRQGPGVTMPRPTRQVKVGYPGDALRAKIEGNVVLEAVVQPDGKVGEVRVKRSLDQKFGLDEECIKTLKKWQFLPGKKDGVAVPVLVEVEMTFVLR